MKTIAPALEVITNSYGSSFTYTKHAEKTNSKAHLWHYHPEIELVYINGGAGKRQIGSHVSYYTNGSLLLIGANLPHCGFTNEQTGNTTETVIHIKPEFLGSDFFVAPEMKKIMKLSLVCAVLLTGMSTYAIDGNEALNLHVLKGNGKVIAFGINQLQKAVISIYDTNGNLIYTENASGKTGILRTFSLEEFPQGKYILEVSDNFKKVQYDINVNANSSVLSSKGTVSVN